jgi:hypothetical protein
MGTSGDYPVSLDFFKEKDTSCRIIAPGRFNSPTQKKPLSTGSDFKTGKNENLSTNRHSWGGRGAVTRIGRNL